MGWQIPAQIEQDIISGKAQYRTFQTGVGGQSILAVPNNAYAVIFGYDFSPAGGGFCTGEGLIAFPQLNPDIIRSFETQQISFYTGTDFYPFIHHIDVQTSSYYNPLATQAFSIHSISNTTISRQVYITSDKDITISVGLLITAPISSVNAIPQTNRTPALLTYGGSPQLIATQTDFGPAASPVQFMQPSPKDYQDFAFGLLPNGASGQAFATPDATRGLADPSRFLIDNFGGNFSDRPACNYFLNLHYALYTESVPEQRG
jgi:hypothetical protein